MTTDENAVPSQHVEQQSIKAKNIDGANKLTVKQLESTEPLLIDNPSRFVLFPVKYNDVQHRIMCIVVRC